MIKSTGIIIFFFITSIALPSSAMAREINYDYIQGTYRSFTDSSPGTDVNADGFAINGSFGATSNLAIVAGYGTRDYDRHLGLDVNFTELNLGLTSHSSITPETDIFGSFSVLKVEGEIDDGSTTTSDSDTGNTISVGLRHMINNTVELNASLTRENIFDDTIIINSFGARLYASEIFSVGVGYFTGNDDVDAILLNVRIDFKK